MLKILIPVHADFGADIPANSVVKWNPGAGEESEGGASVAFPIYLSFFYDEPSCVAKFNSINAIVDFATRMPINQCRVTLTGADALNPSKNGMEPKIKEYLETIFGAGNVVII